MPKLKPGDRVECRLKDGAIVSPYREYDEIRTFEIVAIEGSGYWLYIPPYVLIKGGKKADQYRSKSLGIDKRFLDVDIYYIQENLISKVVSEMDGTTCAKCGEFYHLAEPNQEDGTLICWSCRFNPYR